MTRLMTTLLPAAVAIAALLLPAVTASGQFRDPTSPGFGQPSQNKGKATATVMLDVDHVEPMQTFHVVILFDIEDDWHLYWKNPGAGAAPIDVSVDGPTGFTFDPVRMPRPKIFPSSTGDMYGYDKQVALFVPVTAPQSFSANAAMMSYDLSWAVCNDQRCIIESKTGSFTITRSGFGESDQSNRKPLIEKYRKLLPTLADDSDDIEITLKKGTLTITGPAQGCDTITLLPNNTPGVEFGKPTFDIEEDQFVLTVSIFTEPRNFAGTKPLAGGLVALGDKVSDPSYEFSVPLDR